MSSRIEQIIEEIEEYVESCKYQPLSTTKIVVNKEELEELLRELRLKTPDEIKRYQKIISNKDAILADAQNKADAIIAEAQAKAREMVEQYHFGFVRMERFDRWGQSCTTGIFEKDGREFVFVPGDTVT